MTRSTPTPFLEEVLENPDDDEPRLVYADWLEEQGDPRGEFIRAQCQLASLNATDKEYYDALEEEDRLLIEHAQQWAEELAQDVKKSKFHRGFIDEVTVLASSLLKTEGELFSRAPIHWLRLNRVKGKGAALAELPALTRLRGLDVSGIKISEDDFSALVSSPHLTNLVRFRAGHYSGAFGNLAALAQSENVSQTLRSLELYSEYELDHLAAGDGFPCLESLKLQSFSTEVFEHDLRDLEVPALKELRLGSIDLNAGSLDKLSSIPWCQLERLELLCSEDPKVLLTLRDLGAFENLVNLRLRAHPDCEENLAAVLGDATQLARCERLSIQFFTGELGEPRGRSSAKSSASYLDALGQTQHLENLRDLRLSHLQSQDLKRLLQAADWENLSSFSLADSFLSRDDVEALMASPLRESLKSLTFATVGLEREAVTCLASAVFPSLVCLNFHVSYSGGLIQETHATLSPAQISALLSKGAFPGLCNLGLDWLGMDGEELTRLAEKISMPELRVLSFQHNQCTQASAKAILDSGAFPRLGQMRVHGSLRTKNMEKLNIKFQHRLKLDSYPIEWQATQLPE